MTQNFELTFGKLAIRKQLATVDPSPGSGTLRRITTVSIYEIKPFFNIRRKNKEWHSNEGHAIETVPEILYDQT